MVSGKKPGHTAGCSGGFGCGSISSCEVSQRSWFSYIISMTNSGKDLGACRDNGCLRVYVEKSNY